MKKSKDKEIDATAEAFCLAFEKLGKKEKQRVIERLLEIDELKEDITDLVLIESSRKEEGEDISLDEYEKLRNAQQARSFIDPEIVEVVKKYLKRLQENGIEVSKGVIYGSHVHGSSSKDSDIDLAVISPKFKGDRRKHWTELWKLTIGIDTRIEPIPIILEEYEKEDSSVLVDTIKQDCYEIII